MNIKIVSIILLLILISGCSKEIPDKAGFKDKFYWELSIITDTYYWCEKITGNNYFKWRALARLGVLFPDL